MSHPLSDSFVQHFENREDLRLILGQVKVDDKANMLIVDCILEWKRSRMGRNSQILESVV